MTFLFRDPILFPNFIHTQKRNPETHLKDPDMFWDFISLMPMTTHQVRRWETRITDEMSFEKIFWSMDALNIIDCFILPLHLSFYKTLRNIFDPWTMDGWTLWTSETSIHPSILVFLLSRFLSSFLIAAHLLVIDLWMGTWKEYLYVKSVKETIFITTFNHNRTSVILDTALTPSKWWMVMARLCTVSSITSQTRASAPSPGRRQTRWPRVTRTMPSGTPESISCDEVNIVIIRDLYNAIASGDFPTWTMFIQVMTFKQAENWEFNPFDLTKVKLKKI